MTTTSTIEIRDTDRSGAFSVSLSRLLEAIGIDPSSRWAILELYATGTDALQVDLPALEAEIAGSACGMEFTGAALLELAGDLFQVIDTTIVRLEGEKVRAESNWDSLADQYPVVIEVIDGWIWRISAADPRILRHVRETFRQVISDP